jgi:riboflavin synthase
MLQSAPFLYLGRDYIERHYGDMDMNEPDKFEELLDKADEVRNIMIMVTMNLVNDKYEIDSSVYDNDEDDESEDQSRILRLANKHIKDLANRVLQFYMSSF